MHGYLQTERLVLRHFTRADLDDLVALDADPAVMRYINGGRPTPHDEMRDDSLPDWLAYCERGDARGFWAAIERGTERDTGRFLGWFHLRPQPDDPPDEPELGYRLIREAWGLGYATEGSRALIRKAFAELGARRVHATTMVVNEASWRVMEKAGLRHIRTFRGHWPDRIAGEDEEHGDVEYALTRDEWLAADDDARPHPTRGSVYSREHDRTTRPSRRHAVHRGDHGGLPQPRLHHGSQPGHGRLPGPRTGSTAPPGG